MLRVRTTGAVFFALTVLCLVPTAAFAQSTFTGVVKDDTGAVLPGVTVEASSPALIEKSKATVTDGSGAYRLVDLRPGVYTVTFSLEGFSTVKREGIELTSDFTMTLNSEMKIGGPSGNADRLGCSPGRGRAEHDQVPGALARRARRGADRPDDSGDGAAHHRRVAERT